MALPADKKSMMNLFSDITVDDIKMVDLWSSWQLTTKLKEDIKGEGEVIVEDGDTWHSLSEQLYGSRELWWVLAMYNNVEDPFSLFFDSTVSSSTSRIKVIKPEYIGIIVEDVRRKRIEKEKDRFN